jgi:predicted glycosyltransferase involved in capsule biosynthesis
MSRARFLRFHGFDEEFAGHYGSEDYRFVKIQKYHGTRFPKFRKKYRCLQRQDIDLDGFTIPLNET